LLALVSTRFFVRERSSASMRKLSAMAVGSAERHELHHIEHSASKRTFALPLLDIVAQEDLVEILIVDYLLIDRESITSVRRRLGLSDDAKHGSPGVDPVEHTVLVHHHSVHLRQNALRARR
jgi:hypothetical protein